MVCEYDDNVNNNNSQYNDIINDDDDDIDGNTDNIDDVFTTTIQHSQYFYCMALQNLVLAPLPFFFSFSFISSSQPIFILRILSLYFCPHLTTELVQLPPHLRTFTLLILFFAFSFSLSLLISLIYFYSLPFCYFFLQSKLWDSPCKTILDNVRKVKNLPR